VAEYALLPGELNLKTRQGDEFSAMVTLSEGTAAFVLTGYTVTASITSLVDGSAVDEFTVSVLSETTGEVSIALQEWETQALPSGSYGWSLRWIAPGAVTRTALAGVLEVTRP
jgi:hypothetical protein